MPSRSHKGGVQQTDRAAPPRAACSLQSTPAIRLRGARAARPAVPPSASCIRRASGGLRRRRSVRTLEPPSGLCFRHWRTSWRDRPRRPRESRIPWRGRSRDRTIRVDYARDRGQAVLPPAGRIGPMSGSSARVQMRRMLAERKSARGNTRVTGHYLLTDVTVILRAFSAINPETASMSLQDNFLGAMLTKRDSGAVRTEPPAMTRIAPPFGPLIGHAFIIRDTTAFQ
jgi:hypothetical protein